MRTAEIVFGLAGFTRRGAGSDAERRAANWLAEEIEDAGRRPVVEPFWCRPNWALAHAWHVLLALAGSLLSVHSQRVGGALILVALLSVVADAMLGRSPGRRLTPERASQNVLAPASQAAKVRLIITANYDAGRTGLVHRDAFRAPAARVKRLTHGLTPGWLGWLVIAFVWLEITTIVRLEGTRGTAVGVAQLIPTATLVLALALLLEAGSAEFGPAAGDNGTGVAVALALARALDAAPPRHAAIELVLEGAGDCSGIGLRRHLQRHKKAVNARNTIVIGIGPCAAGRPRWWTSDGPLIPLTSFRRLRAACEAIAEDDPELHARAHRGRGSAPGLAARIRRIPTISVGCLDQNGLVPRSHRPTDTSDAVDDQALERGVEFGLLLVDAIDAQLARQNTDQPSSSPAG